jgi:hypothetical protein
MSLGRVEKASGKARVAANSGVREVREDFPAGSATPQRALAAASQKNFFKSMPA